MQLQVIGIWFWSIGYFVLRFTIKFFQIMKTTVIKVPIHNSEFLIIPN